MKKNPIFAHGVFIAYDLKKINCMGTSRNSSGIKKSPGKLADFVVLSDDITSVKPEKIKNIKPVKNFIGDKCKFKV